MLTKDKKILIVGLGLIGGSYAQGLKKQGFSVGAVTRSPATITYALEQGMIDEGSSEPSAEFIGRYDILVFALYPHVLLKWLADYQQFIKPGALLTDVTGIKGAVVYKIQESLRPDLEFAGAHPMAGREVYGVRNADCNIFKGANYIVTPTAANSEEALRTIEQLGEALGFTRISRLSPEKHDEMIGFLSQLTHCIAIALMTCKDTGYMSQYTGDSFRDLTRIARINEEMWPELFLLNKDELLEQIGLFSGQLDKIRDAIATGNTEELKQMMRLSTERRTVFDKKEQ